MMTLPAYTHFDLPGDFRLSINSNKKMKTVLVQAWFVANLDGMVTARALLPQVLRRGTRTLPDMTAVNRYLEEMYGASLTTSVSKIGEWHVVCFRIEVVNEKFLPGEEGILRRALGFLRELLFDPLRVGDGFHPEFVEQEKENLKLSIESLLDSKEAYAAHRLNQEMCRDEPFRLYEQGNVEDLPAISATSLCELHDEWVKTSPLHIYLAGDVDIEATRNLVTSEFTPDAAPRLGGYPLSEIPPPVVPQGSRDVVEPMDIHQAQLRLGYRHGITHADPRRESLLLANTVLGGNNPRSMLFQNVREKKSLAYSVYSSIDRTKGLLFVAAGIAPQKCKQALGIIEEQVKALQDGDVEPVEIEAAAAIILNANKMLEDNLGMLAHVDFIWRLHGQRFEFQSFRDRLSAVKADDIAEAARLLRHDTTYLLGGAS